MQSTELRRRLIHSRAARLSVPIRRGRDASRTSAIAPTLTTIYTQKLSFIQFVTDLLSVFGFCEYRQKK